jgi:YwiC-like protein
MASATQPAPIQLQRVRALIVPREHGAWGMLLVPLATGATVGLLSKGRAIPLVLFTLLTLALFWLRTPLESLLGISPLRPQSEGERRVVFAAILWLTCAAALSLTALVWDANSMRLLLFGLLMGLAFIGQAILKRRGRNLRMSAQVVGALGLTGTAPAAYLVVTGHFDTRACALWLANWLFAGDQIHFVQLRIHAARAARGKERFKRGQFFLLGQLGMAALLGFLVYSGFLPSLSVIAFVPVFVRGIAWFAEKPQPLAVRRLGWTELAHALAFGVLLVGGFHLAR